MDDGLVAALRGVDQEHGAHRVVRARDAVGPEDGQRARRTGVQHRGQREDLGVRVGGKRLLVRRRRGRRDAQGTDQSLVQPPGGPGGRGRRGGGRVVAADEHRGEGARGRQATRSEQQPAPQGPSLGRGHRPGTVGEVDLGQVVARQLEQVAQLGTHRTPPGSGSSRGDGLPEPGQRVVRLALHRADAHAEDVGRLPLGTVLEVPQHDSGALARGQAVERAQDVEPPHDAVVGVVRRRLLGDRLETDDLSPPAAPGRDGVVVEDPADVGVGLLLAHPLPVAGELDEGALEEVLGEVRVTADEEGRTEQPALPGADVVDEVGVGGPPLGTAHHGPTSSVDDTPLCQRRARDERLGCEWQGGRPEPGPRGRRAHGAAVGARLAGVRPRLPRRRRGAGGPRTAAGPGGRAPHGAGPRLLRRGVRRPQRRRLGRPRHRRPGGGPAPRHLAASCPDRGPRARRRGRRRRPLEARLGPRRRRGGPGRAARAVARGRRGPRGRPPGGGPEREAGARGPGPARPRHR